MTPVEIFGMILGFMLTLAIFSYLLGDNPFFRLAVHLFVGATAGYFAMLTWQVVVKPHIWDRLIAEDPQERIPALIPLVLGIFMVAKLSPIISHRLAWLGNPSMAYLVGVGMAVAAGGAITGTLIPQTWALIQTFDFPTMEIARQGGILSLFVFLGNGVLIILGALTTLIYFQFGVFPGVNKQDGRGKVVKLAAFVGQIFIAITLGLIFGGVYLAALTALIERIYSLLSFLQSGLR